MKHLVVVNPKAFIKEKDINAVIDRIRLYFDQNQVKDYLLHVSRYPRDAVNVVRKIVSNTAEKVRVYSVGGDGIMFDCLNGIAQLPNAELAVIPYGTSNDFVRAFGENKQKQFRDIAKQVTSSSIIPTDMLKCGKRFALNFCCIGVESGAILKYYDIRKKYEWMGKRFGGFVYFIGGVLTLFNKKLVNQYYEVTIDGESYNGRYAAITIANNPCYGGNKCPVPDADPTDGLIDVMLVKSMNRLFLLELLPNYTNGKYHKYPKTIRHIRAKDIFVRSPDPLYLNLDGEAYYDTQIDVTIIHSAVNVVAVDNLPYCRRSLK